MSDSNPFSDWEPSGKPRARVDDSGAAAPPPGIYEGVDFPTYHGWDAASNSRLSDLIDRSPAFCRYNADQPVTRDSDGPALLGTVAHACVLQPDRVERLFIVATQCEATTGKGERCRSQGSNLRGWKWYCNVKGHTPVAEEGEEPDPRLVVPQPTLDLAMRMRDAVWKDEDARALLGNAKREVSLVWEDPDTGLRCKARPDAWDIAGLVITDLKTTSGGHAESAWSRIVHSQRHYRQAPWYMDGAAAIAALHGDSRWRAPESFCWVVVENTPPHEVAVYECHETTIIAGRMEMAAALERYALCRADGVWPSRSPGTPKIGLPEYALRALLPDEGDFQA